GHLVVGGAVDVIEYWTGQPSPGQTPEIMKVVTVAQMHACSRPIDSGVQQISRRRGLTAQPTTDVVGESKQKPSPLPCRNLARRRSQRMSAPTSAFGGEPEMLRTGLIRRC